MHLPKNRPALVGVLHRRTILRHSDIVLRCSNPTGSSSWSGVGTSRPTHRRSHAFTLLEVTLAMAILFSITFVLLQITSTNLRIAKLLQRTTIDASSLAAELSLTNRLEEGSESGDFGDLYPNHTWYREITLVGTNGLFECRFEVLNGREPKPESELVVIFFRPDSARGTAGATLRR